MRIDAGFARVVIRNQKCRKVSRDRNVSYISMPNVRGHEEDEFLKMLEVEVSQLEVKCNELEYSYFLS